MREAIAQLVRDGDTLAIEGFTHLICFAAGHEIIRQQKRDLTLCRLTPDLIYDQIIAAGCAKKLVFSYLGNPGVGSLHAVRRAVEKGIPAQLEVEEYSHFGMVWGGSSLVQLNSPFTRFGPLLGRTYPSLIRISARWRIPTGTIRYMLFRLSTLM